MSIGSDRLVGWQNVGARVGRWLGWAVVACAWANGVVAVSPWFEGPGHDREVFRYAGMVLREGGLPYVDVYDHKPPLIYVVSALTDGLGPWGLWLADSLLLGVALVGLGWAAVRRRWPLPPVYPLLLVCLLRAPPFVEGGGLTRSFTASLCALAVALGLGLAEGRARFALLGAAVAMVGLFQQEQALALAVFAAGLTLTARDRVRAAADGAVGAAAAAAPVLLWLATAGAWDAFVEAAFGFNVSYYGVDISPAQRLGDVVRQLGARGLLAPVAAVVSACLAVGLGRWYGSRAEAPAPADARPGTSAAASHCSRHAGAPASVVAPAQAAALAVACLCLSLGGGYFGHYFLGPLPYLVAGFGVALDGLRRIGRTLAAVFALTLLLLPVNWPDALTGSLARLPDAVSAPAYARAFDGKPVAEIAAYRGRAGQLLVFRYPPMLALNTDHHIVAPTRYAYSHLWDLFPDWDADRRRFRTLLGDLDRHRTALILDFSADRPFEAADLNRLWTAYRDAHYRLERALPTGGHLYRRRDPP